jgi:hypothetical protein
MANAREKEPSPSPESTTYSPKIAKEGENEKAANIFKERNNHTEDRQRRESMV